MSNELRRFNKAGNAVVYKDERRNAVVYKDGRRNAVVYKDV